MDDALRAPFLGRGWAFPVLGAGGGPETVAYEEDIRQAVRIVLATGRGERPMRPDFGADLQRLAFRPLSTTTLALLRHRVEQALVLWEPRIDVVEVSARADAPATGRVTIEVDYRVRATNTFYNLVYPFYLVEGQPE